MEYKKGQPYDVFLEIDPPTGFIKGVVKQLKAEAYKLLKAKQDLPAWADWLESELQATHAKICRTIKSYEIRLRNRERTGRWDLPEDKGRRWDNLAERAREVDIKALYSGRLRLSGGRYVGRCPFHQEKTASFIIYPDNHFHCFGCSAHGSSIDFVMRLHNVSFKDAIKLMV